MDEVRVAYDAFRKVLFKTWDVGFSEGLEESFMLADIKDHCADQNDGIRMDATIDNLFNEWKQSR